MQTYTLIYTSKASTRVTKASLRKIAESSARRNERVGVTGLLLYGSGTYLQLLEGSQSTVKALYRRIEQDPRHHHARLLFESHISSRVFPDWHMGQLNLSASRVIPADTWTEFNNPFSDKRLKNTPRNQAIAWVRAFIEQQDQVAA